MGPARTYQVLPDRAHAPAATKNSPSLGDILGQFWSFDQQANKKTKGRFGPQTTINGKETKATQANKQRLHLVIGPQ